jgi:hypothetical protein
LPGSHRRFRAPFYSQVGPPWSERFDHGRVKGRAKA